MMLPKPMKGRDLKPYLAWGTDSPYDGIKSWLTQDYVAEPKLDGVRVLMAFGSDFNTVSTSRDRTANFPHLRDAVVPEMVGVVLDGELVAATPRLRTASGSQTDSLLNASVTLTNSNPATAVGIQREFGSARLYVFDVLRTVFGHSVMDQPYEARRALLEALVARVKVTYPTVGIDLVATLPATVESITAALDAGFEGVMLKKRSGLYYPARRGWEWLKVKRYSTADAFVVGFTDGEGSNTGLIGSLELAVTTQDGPRVVARVGNLTTEARRMLTDPQGGLVEDAYGIVVEFMAQGLGRNGLARHPHLVRFRPDKEPQDCGEDQLAVFAKV